MPDERIEAQSRFRVTLTMPSGVRYVQDSRAMSQMAAFGEALHDFSAQHREINLAAMGDSWIQRIDRAGNVADIEGVPS